MTEKNNDIKKKTNMKGRNKETKREPNKNIKKKRRTIERKKKGKQEKPEK